jgi:hypothetical protein
MRVEWVEIKNGEWKMENFTLHLLCLKVGAGGGELNKYTN